MRIVQLSLVPILAVVVLSCGGGGPVVSTSEVVAVHAEPLPDDPGADVWDAAPAYTAELLPQDMVEPRLLEPSTTRVEVRAATDGRRVAFRLRWDDPTCDDVPRTGEFPDACAVQLPRGHDADVPAPQMGEAGRAVEITYWRATWQSSVDGRPDEIRAIYPGAKIDHYPFQAASLESHPEAQRRLAEQYAPARALGNHMAGPRSRPVEDLLAEGPGTLTRVEGGDSDGRGARDENGWSVVLSRPLPAGLGPGDRTQVAFAVWDGGRDETGSRKMRSVWIPLRVAAEEGRP